MSDLNRYSEKKSKTLRLVTIFKLYVTISVVMVVNSILYLLSTFIPHDLSVKQSTLVLMVIAGSIIASVFSIIVAVIDAKNNLIADKDIFRNKIIFLQLFDIFESRSRKVLTNKNMKYNSLSYRSLISELYENRIISTDDVEKLDYLLKIRNFIAHAKPIVSVFGNNEDIIIDEACNELRNIIDKLSM